MIKFVLTRHILRASFPKKLTKSSAQMEVEEFDKPTNWDFVSAEVNKEGYVDVLWMEHSDSALDKANSKWT